MAHGDVREGKWRGNWWMVWAASTLHTTSEHGVSSITTADAHTSAASSRLNWRLRRCKWTHPFRRKTKSGFCGVPSHFNWPLQQAGLVSEPHWLDAVAKSRFLLLPGESPQSRPQVLMLWQGCTNWYVKNCSLVHGLNKILNTTKVKNVNK